MDAARLLEAARGRRWFRGKGRAVRGAAIADEIPLGDGYTIVLLAVDYAEGPGETYVLPVTAAGVDAVAEPRFAAALLDLVRGGGARRGARGELAGVPLAGLEGRAAGDLTAEVGSAEQTNTAIVYGGKLLLKLFRAVEEGPSAEDEIGRFFAAHGAPRGVAPLVGALEHRVAGREPSTVAVVFGFVPNRGDAWSVVLREVDAYLAGDDTVLARVAARMRLLGTRTAELHLALAADASDPRFAPERFDAAHQRAILASARALADRTFELLGERGGAGAGAVSRAAVDRALAAVAERPIDATRIRIHGDYHLGQVLDTGDDFIIIDFEGEPGRPLAERRAKLGPLRDVAGMLRSFDYAGAAGLRARASVDGASPARARAFTAAASAAFTEGYLELARGAGLLPARDDDTRRLLDFYLVEKCVYEVGYELNNRPDWVAIPLAGLRALVGGD